MFAASALGAVIVPIDPRSEEEKLIFQIQNSGAKGVIYSAEFAQSSGNQIFATSEASQHIVVTPTGGKWVIWFAFRNTFKTIQITCQTAFLKKSGFVFSAIYLAFDN
jgi:acyl-CoA synthetase (AMP-forming)/AMP-acid ligase II